MNRDNGYDVPANDNMTTSYNGTHQAWHRFNSFDTVGHGPYPTFIENDVLKPRLLSVVERPADTVYAKHLTFFYTEPMMRLPRSRNDMSKMGVILENISIHGNM